MWYKMFRWKRLLMPKKFQGENTKSVAARARKAEAKAEEKTRQEQAREEAYWQDDDKRVQRKAQRKNEFEQKRQQELERKQANKQAYEQEMNTLAVKAKQTPPPKVTQAQIERERQLEEMRREEMEKERLLERKKLIVPNETEELPENVNRLSIEGEARNVDEAIVVLKQAVGGSTQQQQQDKHPEKRLKAAYSAFEERRLSELKSERPTLRLSQLKQLVKREWLKSPENPLNQTIMDVIQ